MTPDRNKQIKDRAYEIWEREGRPEGRENAHWERARSEIEAAGGWANQSYSSEADKHGVSSGGQMTGGILEGSRESAPQGFDDGSGSAGNASGAKRPRRQKQATKAQDR